MACDRDETSKIRVAAAGSIGDHQAMQRDYERIGRAIEWLVDHEASSPSLADVARAVGLSPFHFQRVFRRFTGITPKRWLEVLRLARAKEHLRAGAPVLRASLAAGLSGPGRLHDLFVAHDAISPGDFARQGEGLVLREGVHDTPFGRARILVSDRGVCALDFVDAADGERALPHARRIVDPATATFVERIFRAPDAVPLDVRGTNFQIQVWRALLAVPEGAVTSYDDLAGALGRPGCARAVASAVARNPVAVLIPCHRVLRRSGALAGYRWGVARKAALLAHEAAKLG